MKRNPGPVWAIWTDGGYCERCGFFDRKGSKDFVTCLSGPNFRPHSVRWVRLVPAQPKRRAKR